MIIETDVFSSILDQVDERLPNVKLKEKEVEEALSKGGDWRKVEEPERLQFRLSQLALNKEAAALIAAKKPSDVKFNVLERIIKFNELMSVCYLYKGAAAARTVGRVHVRTATSSLGYGTGFMVSPHLMMTNHHVLENKDIARNSLVEMNYRETPEGVSDSSYFRLLPDEFFVANEELDFALVAVEEKNQKEDLISNYGFTKIIPESGKAVVGEHVNIIQHPSAEPKQIAVRQNKIIGTAGNFLHYMTDTERGSSGSPVYNDGWNLVALHHAGKPARNAQGKILMIDGNPWDGSPFTRDQIKWDANEGVRISKIINYLDSLETSMDERCQQLYLEIFKAQPSVPEIPAEVNGGQVTTPKVLIEPDGSTSMYLRLNLAGIINGSHQKQLSFSDQPGLITQPSTPKVISSPNANRAGDIIRHAIHQFPEYYNSQRDEADKIKYYRNTDLNGSPDHLFHSLSNLLKNSHTNKLSYRTARLEYLYPVVDKHEFGKLRNIYSGTILDPEELIRLELDLIERYEQEFISALQSESFATEEDRMEALDFLEASLPFNCEHVVPQSWFSKRNPMRADLHHLFACQPACNSFRSNIPYWQFNPMEEVFQSQCGRRESNKFEPESGHGPVARATLYFLLRYPDEIGNVRKEMQPDRLNILLDWHHRDPVSRYELHRNATIFAVQGNRNPLIDHSELANKINFELGFD